MDDLSNHFTPGQVSVYYGSRVPRLKQQPRAKWRGPCPIHKGRHDNFVVDPSTGRWFCHSTCGRGGDIFALEEALNGGDFPARKAEVFRLVGRVHPERNWNGIATNGNSWIAKSRKLSNPTAPVGNWREVARYPYVDLGGNLLFEVVRYLKPGGSKSFIQTRPTGVEAAGTTDPERTGGVEEGGIVVGLEAGKYLLDSKPNPTSGKSTWKRASEHTDNRGAECEFRECPRVPYRLPKLLGAEVIYLVEGEKDVHTLEGWGLVASCNPGGTGGGRLYAGWGDHFRGKHIVILPDNDAPGQRHAALVAANLLTAASSIRMLELPGLTANGDVTDWQKCGGTLEQFLEVAGAAPVMDLRALSELRAAWGLSDEQKDTATNAESGDAWPKPEPIQSERPPVQTLANDLLPDSFRPLVLDIAERMQVPMDYPAVALVLCLAGVVSRRAIIQPKANDTGFQVVPNLWGGIIAPPGYLKSPVLQAATRLLERIQTEWRKEHQQALETFSLGKEEFDLRHSAWKELFKRGVKDGKLAPERPKDTTAVPVEKRLIVNDATFEALHQTMRDNPAGILVNRDELTGWWSQLDRLGREGERAFCLQAWNGETGHTIDRIGRGTIHVPACCMSMMGGIQPGRLRSYLVDALKDGPGNDGLIQRFQLLVWPDAPAEWEYVDRPPNAGAEQRVETIFRRLVQLDPEYPVRFRFAPAAQLLFVEWLTGIEEQVRGPELHPALASHLSKYRSLMPSLALLFELADWAAVEGDKGLEGARGDALQSFHEVSLEHAQQAAAWCDYLFSHARRVYSYAVNPQLHAARDLAEKLKGRSVGAKGFFSCREVYLKGWSGLDTPEAVKAAAEILKDAGWIRELPGESGPSGGRPSNRYELNPEVWK